MAFRADRKNPKASMMATFSHFSDGRQRVADQVRHELMGFGDPHTSVPWGDELIAIAEELTTAYGDEYREDWQVAMDRFCSDAAFGASTLMCAEEQARLAPESTWAYRWDGSRDNYVSAAAVCPGHLATRPSDADRSPFLGNRPTTAGS